MRQEPRQSIAEFHAQSIKLFAAYRDHRQFMYFMMHIRDEFENTQASLLHRSSLPTLEVALAELISEETRQQTRRAHSTNMVLAIAPSSSSTQATLAAAVASSKPRRFHGQCHYCKEDGHRISDFPKKKTKDARDALKTKASYSSKPVVAVSTSYSISTPSFVPPLSSLSIADLEAIITQDPKTGQLVGTGRKVGCLFELTSLHLPHSCSPPSFSAVVSSSV
ncbi:uncharacterized protein LOC131153907 [Malania oleifera]|uniref:uncharacterized protein LOC131153907 n=1 Tax=Malania oleifera TaxID=397392 RepID=UPI0025AE3511|nr:uncharacterized protein LOC131153907 [Malania oleifera]